MNRKNDRTPPKSVFPYRCVSQRLALDYDEIDDIMDTLFADLFASPGTDGEPRTKDALKK